MKSTALGIFPRRCFWLFLSYRKIICYYKAGCDAPPLPQSLIYDILFLTIFKRPIRTEKETAVQFILLPFALCFLLYIRQENRYRFWAATALKVTLTLTLALCLLVALLRRYSPVLLAANLGMVLCAGGDYFLQYIRRSPGKFTCGILLFSLGHVCNLVALFLLAPFRPSALTVLAGLLALALALKGIGRWDTSENEPWLTIYIGLVAMTAAKSLSAAIAAPGAPGSLLLGLGGLLFFLSDIVLGIWNYQKNHILVANLNWLLYFSGQFLLCAGYIAAA